MVEQAAAEVKHETMSMQSSRFVLLHAIGLLDPRHGEKNADGKCR